MKMHYPRVLIINQQSMKKNNATGITLRSLWENWPTDRILEVYIDPYEAHVEDKPDLLSICMPPNWVNKIAHSGSAKKLNTEIKQQEVHTKQSLKASIRQAAVLAIDMIPVEVSKDTLSKIDQFSPEVIYTLGSGVGPLTLSYKFSKKYNIPIVIHYMDNWVENLQWENNLLIKPYRIALRKAHNRCLEHCNVGLAISPQMAAAYEKKYGISFYPIMNSVEVEKYHMEKKAMGEIISFVYAGGLHLDRWKALLDISKAISETKINGMLHIYTSIESANKYKTQFPDNTVFHKPVSHDDVINIYRESDVLVHAETENPLLLGFFKYSISTKIPEYLASGRIVLFYGPSELGLYQYLNENKAAYLADGYKQLCETMKDIKEQKNTIQILSNAEKLAYRMHDAKKARALLLNTLQEAVDRQV